MRGSLIATKLSVFAMSSQISAPTPVNFVLSTSDGCQNRVGGGGYGSLISRRHLGVEARTLLPEVVRRVRNAVPEVRSCRARAAGCQTTLDRGWRRIDVFSGNCVDVKLETSDFVRLQQATSCNHVTLALLHSLL